MKEIWKTSKEKVLETALVIATGFLVLYFVYDVREFLLVALIAGCVGIFLKPLGKVVAWAWYKLSEGLGMVMPKVLLTVIFYVFLFPFAMIARAFAKDPLQLKRKGEDGSYWVDRDHDYQKEDLENTW